MRGRKKQMGERLKGIRKLTSSTKGAQTAVRTTLKKTNSNAEKI